MFEQHLQAEQYRQLEHDATTKWAPAAYTAGRASALNNLRAAASELESLLHGEVREEDLKQLLKRPTSRMLFAADAVNIFPEHPLGSDHRIDLVVLLPGGHYRLIELERSTHALYTKGGDPTAAHTHAKQQVEDWQDWIERNLPYAREHLPGISAPEGLVIIGRNTGMTDRERARLARSNATSAGRMRVMTYDDLLETALTIVQNLETSVSRSTGSADDSIGEDPTQGKL